MMWIAKLFLILLILYLLPSRHVAQDHGPKEGDLQKRIEAACKKAIKFLKPVCSSKKVFKRFRKGRNNADLYTDSTINFAAYALLRSGVTKDELKIALRQAFRRYPTARLKPYNHWHACKLAFDLMALIEADREAYKDRIAKICAKLISKKSRRKKGAWGYHAGPGVRRERANVVVYPDTFYPVLALHKADLIDDSLVPDKVWKEILRAIKKQQISNGSWPYGAAITARARKKGRWLPTCAGIIIFTICNYHLNKDQGLEKILSSEEIKKAIRWLDKHFRVGVNTGAPDRWMRDLAYQSLFLTGMVGTLTKTQRFKGKDWYEKGVKYILRKRRSRKGYWTNEHTGHSDRLFDTALVLLFLNKQFIIDFDNSDPKGEGPEQGSKIDPEALDAPLQKAVAYLLKRQKKDGRWAGPPAYRYHRLIGVPRASATTSLCALALHSYSATDKGIKDRVEKTVRHILKVMQKKKLMKKALRARDSYWGWAFAYGIQFLLKIRDGYQSNTLKKGIDEAIKKMIKSLKRMQNKKGSWCYMYGPYHIPGRYGHTFYTAVILLQLLNARDNGFKVAPNVLKKAIKILERSRTLKGAYVYSNPAIPGFGEKDIRGSLSRSAVCELALYKAGVRTKDNAKKAIQNFFRYHRFLEKAYTSESHMSDNYNNVSYFYLFGHYYISECLKIADKKTRDKYLPKLFKIILEKQHPNGSWVDSKLCGCKNYGTAMGILILLNIKSALSG